MNLLAAAPRASFLNEAEVADTLAAQRSPDAREVRTALARARQLEGLGLGEVATLVAVEDPALLRELFAAARGVKNEIYGSRLVLCAPLRLSHHGHDDCACCAMRVPHTAPTRPLIQGEIAAKVRALLDQGHERVLLVASEACGPEGFRHILNALETVHRTRTARGEIRHVDVEIPPLTVEQFRELKRAGLSGTCQLFPETYHRETYARVHLAARSPDFAWRLTALDRALEAGLGDVGIAVGLGLHDWRFELLALMQHIRHLERTFGVSPRTLSVPRLDPAVGSPRTARPPQAVSDADFRKLIAILRLAVPYTGLILSTRESARIRRECFALGVSQVSADPHSRPGGLAEPDAAAPGPRSQPGEQPSLEEVVREVVSLGYVPSFCTARALAQRDAAGGASGFDLLDEVRPDCRGVFV